MPVFCIHQGWWVKLGMNLNVLYFNKEARTWGEGMWCDIQPWRFYELVYVTLEGVRLREYSWEVINAHLGICSS